LAGDYSVEIQTPGGEKLYEGTLAIRPLGEAYALAWTGYLLLPSRRPARFSGIGTLEGENALIATFQQDDAPPFRATVRELFDKIPSSKGERYADAFRHGSLRGLLYAPRGNDPQAPHDQDEVYMVVRGSGSFTVEDARCAFGEGDLLFVPAKARHRFESFTDDLVVWALFYGPAGGEVPDDVRREIEHDNGEFATAFASGNAAAVANLYTETGRLYPPNQPIIEGRAAMVAFWDGAMKAGVQEVALSTNEVFSLGMFAAETGKATLTGTDGRVIDEGKYIVIWQRVDGLWRLHRDCWNSSRPATPG
jgi:ketosteroid isomerase-like protein/mannose-6-phosphate isomerase-like protein (cupin superfamily)